MISPLIKFIASFFLSMAILSIPYNGHPLFHSLYPKISPMAADTLTISKKTAERVWLFLNKKLDLLLSDPSETQLIEETTHSQTW